MTKDKLQAVKDTGEALDALDEIRGARHLLSTPSEKFFMMNIETIRKALEHYAASLEDDLDETGGA